MSATPAPNPSKFGRFLLGGVFFLMFLVVTATPVGLMLQSEEGILSTPEHRQLMAAIEARDAAEASRLMQAHFRSGLEAAA